MYSLGCGTRYSGTREERRKREREMFACWGEGLKSSSIELDVVLRTQRRKHKDWTDREERLQLAFVTHLNGYSERV